MHCVCGHAKDTHRHLRQGRECGVCPCGAYRADLLGLLRRLWGRRG